MFDVKGTVAWVEANIPEKTWHESGDTPLDALGWFCAVNTARCVFDMTTRELAREIHHDGIGPFRTEEQIAEFLETLTDEESSTETRDADLRRQLAEFWKERA